MNVKQKKMSQLSYFESSYDVPERKSHRVRLIIDENIDYLVIFLFFHIFE